MVRWRWIPALFVAALAIAKPPEETNGGFSAARMDHDGIERRYLVRAPSRAGKPVAIVVMLHGHTGSAERLIGSGDRPAPYRTWNAIADREGLLLVAPQGLVGGDGKTGWNDCRADAESNPDADDAGFIAALIDALRKEYRIETSRAYAIGSSNGGQMALRMAIEHPGTIDAVAAVLAAMPADSECATPQKPVPIVFFNGTEDPLLPFAGGRIGQGRFRRGTALSTDATLALWSKLAGGDAVPTSKTLPDSHADDGSRATRETYADGAGRPAAVLYRIRGGGHLEPSRSERYPAWLTTLLGRQNGDIEMADEAWAFFEEHAR